jgi:hypothetical protein
MTRDILRFWKQAEKQWPVLGAMARDFLAIPAAGVGVERLFNVARDICTFRRYRLRPETIRMLMMIMSVDKFEMKQELLRARQERIKREERLGDVAEELEEDSSGAEFGTDSEEESDEDMKVEGLISDTEDRGELDPDHQQLNRQGGRHSRRQLEKRLTRQMVEVLVDGDDDDEDVEELDLPQLRSPSGSVNEGGGAGTQGLLVSVDSQRKVRSLLDRALTRKQYISRVER